MEQFSLEKWLEDNSRKVVTRRGNLVRIICTDRKHGEDELPIVFLEECLNGEFLLTCRKDGRSDNYDTQYDLFFAAEEELTEFEQKLVEIVKSEGAPIGNLENFTNKDIEAIHCYSEQLLDLARKELEQENSEFKPKFTYNEKDYSELANKLIEFRNNTPLCSVSYRDGEGRKVILHYEKEILDLVKKEIEKLNPYNGKQKQEWSKENNERLVRIHQFIWANRKGDTDEIYQQEQDADWLMTLESQPKQEWSEEDKEILDGIIDTLDGLCLIDSDRLNWLKSLKPNHWKPSEEQMQALNWVSYNYALMDKGTEEKLQSLYNDLKNL